ncbi:hypothetical protein BOSE46_10109 [Bosea sp. 46]|nr:hypothetical protein BOSE46_10109 [Bosea sp. 46]
MIAVRSRYRCVSIRLANSHCLNKH